MTDRKDGGAEKGDGAKPLSPDREAQEKRQRQLERHLFEAKQSINGRTSLAAFVVRDGLSHALGSENDAVKREAARMLRDLQPIRCAR